MIRTTLGAILQDPRSLPKARWVWLPDDDQEWEAGTAADIAEGPDDEPEEDGWIAALITEDVTDIVDNAEQQVDDLDLRTRLEAFRHYYDHDAFIELAANEPS